MAEYSEGDEVSETIMMLMISDNAYDEIAKKIREAQSPFVRFPVFELVDGNMMIRMGNFMLERQSGNRIEPDPNEVIAERETFEKMSKARHISKL